MTDRDGERAVARLCTGTAIVVALWCCLLPRLLGLGPVARHVRLMEERGVDPAAMYYTELERLPLPPAWIEDRVLLWPWRADRGGATLARDHRE